MWVGVRRAGGLWRNMRELEELARLHLHHSRVQCIAGSEPDRPDPAGQEVDGEVEATVDHQQQMGHLEHARDQL